MDYIRRLENPIFIRVIRQQWKFSKICLAVIAQSVLLLVICQLLFRAKLGRFADLIFLSEALLVLLVAPYLACRGLSEHGAPLPSTGFLQLSRIAPRWVWGSVILGSQLYTFCFLGLTALVCTILIPLISDITYLQVFLLHLVFGIYITVGAVVGGLLWCIFRHTLFATEGTYFVWSLLIGGVFLLRPLERYLENLQPVIPPFLYLNPLSAVCNLLVLDLLRTPYLYELTPIASYLFFYPAWYIVPMCYMGILIGICGVALAWRNRV